MSTDALPLPDPTLLPDDPAILKALVVQLLEELRQAHARLERQEHHMHLLLKRIYGSTSEKVDPRQGVLFDAQTGAEEATADAPPPATDAPAASPSAPKNRDRHGRGRIPDETRREEVVHDLTDAEKTALGGQENLVELPPETSEQLDWRPSTLFVAVHVRKKYARKEQLPESGLTLAEQNVVVAEKPPEAIPGSLAGPGLMAQVIVSKGADHLPLHRWKGSSSGRASSSRGRRWTGGGSVRPSSSSRSTRWPCRWCWLLMCCTPMTRRSRFAMPGGS